jgi:acyl-CoA dehydrogenase
VSGLSNVEYAHLAEMTGRSPHIAPEALNCSAPDTGNMEVLHLFGTPAQQNRWLRPLLDGEIRSAFAMTEPAVASSDARNIATEIRRDGDEYVINGRKWWISGSADPRCKIMIVMGKTNPDAHSYQQQSMVLVPLNTPGVTLVRPLPVFGYQDQHGHCEITFEDVRVPASNLIGEQGGGFAIAQARLGPGRIHHCMRWLGQSRRAFDMLCERAVSRYAHGSMLAEKQTIQNWVADSMAEMQAARLMTLQAAWKMDQEGAAAARVEIAMIKYFGAKVLYDVIDRAIQVHGSLGFSSDLPLESMYRAARAARIYDGPDEVHRQTVARRVLKGYEPHEVPTEHIPTRQAEAQRRFADLLADLTVDA